MTAYLILDLDISDPDRFAEYQAAFPAIAARYGGRYLVRGGDFTVNGEWGAPLKRLVMIEFPDRAALAATMGDPEYQPLIPIREASALTRSIIVDGADASHGTPAP